MPSNPRERIGMLFRDALPDEASRVVWIEQSDSEIQSKRGKQL